MKPWGSYYRLLVVFAGFFCLTSVCSNHNIISFTFICMVDDFSDAVDHNGTLHSIYAYTTEQKTMILWAVGVGTILATLPINYFYIHYGARYPFFIAGVVSNLATLFLPSAAKFGFAPLLVVRFLQGVAYAADFAAIGSVVARWAPLKETAIFIASLTTFTSISSIVTNAVTGVICESAWGWRWSFYAHAIVGLGCFMFWVIIYTDDPADDRRVSKKELTKIQKNKSAAHLEKSTKVPYKAIFTSPVILCVWLCAFVELSTVVLITQYAPLYFRKVLNFGIKETGFWLGLSIAIHIPLRFVIAVISDKMRCMSEWAKIQFFNTGAVGVAGIFFGVLGYVPAENKYVAVLVLTVLECFIGCNCGGFYKCGTLHARQFSHVVISAIQFMKCVALFTGPALVGLLVDDETDRFQWVNVFLVYCVSMVLATFLGYLFLTDQPATWTEETPEKEKTAQIRFTEVSKSDA